MSKRIRNMSKIISVILSIVLLLGIFPMQVFAEEFKPITLEPELNKAQLQATGADALSEFLLDKIDQEPDEIVAIKESTFETKDQPQRASVQSNTDSPEFNAESQELENTDNELTLQLTNGTYSLYSFSEAIKFTDENGVVRYKDTTIVPQINQELLDGGYNYTNGPNDFRINFASAVDKGVFTEYDGVKTGFIPLPNNEDYSQTGNRTTFMLDGNSVDSFEYPNLYGEGTILRYTAQLNALKKDIILPEYTGQNEFHFVLDTYGNTAVLSKDGKTIQIVNPEINEIIQEFVPIYAYDSFDGTYSDDFHYTEDCYYTLSSREDGKYNMGVVVSEEYLSNPDLIYPVTIDPSSVSLSNLQDAPVYSSLSSKNYGGATSMCFGRSPTNGSGRSYIKFNVSSIGKSANITNATLTLRELTGRTTSTTTGIYMASGSWTETGLTWNNKPGYNNLQSSLNINSPGGNFYYKFNVKSAVQKWVNGTTNNGFAIVSNDENNTSNFWRAFATKEYSTSSYRPVLKVDYTVIDYTILPNATYYIKNKWTGKYLDVQDAASATTSIINVIAWPFSGNKNQQWRLAHQGDGWYKFYTLWPFSPSKCLDITGSNIDVFNDGNGDYLLFRIISNGDGTYRIMPKANGNTTNVLDVSGNSANTTDYKKNVLSYPWENTDNQKWTFEKVNFGCAWEFKSKNNWKAGHPNCFGYALGLTYTPPLTMNQGDSVETVATSVESYVKNTLRRSIRRISGPTSQINSNEYRFCMRVGNHSSYRYPHDYHFWVQTNTGAWSDKHGTTAVSSDPVFTNPSTASWDLESYKNYYDSSTIYFAATLS